MSNQSEGEYDEYEREYGPGGYQEEEDSHQPENMNYLIKVNTNEKTLCGFPNNKPLRVFYSNLHVSSHVIHQHFSDKIKGIISIIGQLNGAGHFVVDSKQTASALIQC